MACASFVVFTSIQCSFHLWQPMEFKELVVENDVPLGNISSWHFHLSFHGELIRQDGNNNLVVVDILTRGRSSERILPGCFDEKTGDLQNPTKFGLVCDGLFMHIYAHSRRVRFDQVSPGLVWQWLKPTPSPTAPTVQPRPHFDNLLSPIARTTKSAVPNVPNHQSDLHDCM